MSTLKIAVSRRDHIHGDDDAPVTLVEFGDYECPYCGLAYPVVKKLQRRFGADLRFVFRNFPLIDLHPHAVGAASVAEFAAQHGHFWAVHDALFENQRDLGASLYQKIVAAVGLSPAEMLQALDRDEFVERIRADYLGGVQSGVRGTPTYFINGQRHDGPVDEPGLVHAVHEAILAAQSTRRVK